jgi:peptide subunit release factor 1 (eRF1)
MIIVKKDGSNETLDKKKLFNSIYESFLNAHHNKKTADNFAKKVSKEEMIELEFLAKKTGAEVHIISTENQDGEQFLNLTKGIGAILRFPME